MRTISYRGVSKVSVSHLVLRGAYLPGTVRCIDLGIRFRHPPYTDINKWPASAVPIPINCYADVRVSAYVLGSGPSTLTVLVYFGAYWFEAEKEYIEGLRNPSRTDANRGG